MHTVFIYMENLFNQTISYPENVSIFIGDFPEEFVQCIPRIWSKVYIVRQHKKDMGFLICFPDNVNRETESNKVTNDEIKKIVFTVRKSGLFSDTKR